MSTVSLVLATAIALAPVESPSRGYAGVTEADPASATAPAPAPTQVSPPAAPEVAPTAEDPLADDPLVDDEAALDEDPALDEYDALRDSPEALKAAGWVRSGILFTVVGGVLTIGAVIMSFTDPSSLSAGNGGQETARTRASMAMGIPGGAMIAGGVAMLVVGKRQQRRLGASLQALRRGGGVAITLRF